MDRHSKQYTAFTTPDGGLYHFEVMPFGLGNTTATFQRLMSQKVLAGILLKYCASPSRNAYLGITSWTSWATISTAFRQNPWQSTILQSIPSSRQGQRRNSEASSLLHLAPGVHFPVCNNFAPLTDLLKTNKHKWTPDANNALATWKDVFSRPITLSRPTRGHHYTLQTEARGVGIAAELLQTDADGN